MELKENEKRVSNLNKNEWKALKELKENESIVIKEADKGGSVVIMNRTHYERMINQHLNDTKTYKETDTNIDKKVMTSLKKHVSTYKTELTSKEIDYLTKFNSKSSNFYGLPKIHKSKIIAEEIKKQNSEIINILEPSDLKVRPIIAGPECPTKRLSNLIDIILKPMVQKIKSYIKDDIDFLSKCPRSTKDSTMLYTYDVVSLYTNIPHALGLEAIEYWLRTFPEVIDSRFSKEFILESLEFVLKNNTFIFNNKSYIQLCGSAMGTIVAPTYANLTMGYLETKLYKLIEETFGIETRKHIEENWKRFLDDCFIPLDTNIILGQELLHILNNLNESIKFTEEHNKHQIPFLDIKINQTDNRIWMDIYY